MNDQRDPLLAAAFDRAERNLIDDDFTGGVMDRIRQRQRWIMAARIAIVGIVIALEVLLAAPPVQTTVALLSQALATSLVPLQSDWLAVAFGPLNSIAGLIGLGLLATQFLFRKLLR